VRLIYAELCSRNRRVWLAKHIAGGTDVGRKEEGLVEVTAGACHMINISVRKGKHEVAP
jgi:hypothetical protein